MTKKKRPNKNQMREAILAETERQIAEKGLRNVTTRGVAAEVGCVGGTIYTRFADFDDLVLHVNSRTLALLNGRLELANRSTMDKPLAEQFYQMALAYLDFAVEEPRRWAALFEHRMPEGKSLPDWHLKEHLDLFRHVERSLSPVCQGVPEDERMVLARTIYSAVHGVVSLSLEDRLASLPLQQVREQLRILVSALSEGLQRSTLS